MDEVELLIERVFGTGRDLDALQMAARAVVVFFITLALVRIGGMRAFGHKSAFDAILVIMLGAVLSRAIAGVSPFWPTLAAGAVLVAVHRALASATTRSQWLERLLKGRECLLYERGTFYWDTMRACGISRDDLDEAARTRANRRTVAEVAAVYMETSGQLTVIVEERDRARASWVSGGDGTSARPPRGHAG